MRSLKFYYIYDNINECVISEKPFFAPNDLSAAIVFRDSFIKNEKSMYNYKSLDLVRFGEADILPDGDYVMRTDEKSIKIQRLIGSEIMTFIQAEIQKLGIEDDFLEEEETK